MDRDSVVFASKGSSRGGEGNRHRRRRCRGNRAVASGSSAGGRGEEGRLWVVTAGGGGPMPASSSSCGYVGIVQAREGCSAWAYVLLVGEVLEMSGCVGGGGGRICQVMCRQPHVVRLLWPASSSRDESVEICRGRQRFRPGSSGDVGGDAREQSFPHRLSFRGGEGTPFIYLASCHPCRVGVSESGVRGQVKARVWTPRIWDVWGTLDLRGGRPDSATLSLPPFPFLASRPGHLLVDDPASRHTHTRLDVLVGRPLLETCRTIRMPVPSIT